MLNMIAAGSAVLSLLAPMSITQSVPDEEVVAPDGVKVKVIEVNGSGCPAGEGTVITSADGNSVRVTLPTYFAWDGGESGPTDFRKNCQYSLQVDRPAGLTYAVARITSSGFAYLAPGGSGLTKVSLYFQGLSATVSASHTFSGPKADTWQTVDTIEPASLGFAPCGTNRNLNVNTELRASLGTAPQSMNSLMVRDPLTTFRLTWKRCPTS